MCWYMRGGMSFEEGMQTSYEERQIINDLIKENLDVTKQTKLPFF